MGVRRQMQEIISDGCISVIIILISSMNGFRGPECSFSPFKMWVEVELGYYVFNVLFLISYFQYLKRVRRESIAFLVLNGLLGVVHCGWLIYGNVCYFGHSADCIDELQDTESANLTWTMLIQIIIGYWPLLKCVTYGTILVCCAPFIIRAMRRARRPDA